MEGNFEGAGLKPGTFPIKRVATVQSIAYLRTNQVFANWVRTQKRVEFSVQDDMEKTLREKDGYRWGYSHSWSEDLCPQ
jgi:hypothetical protein